MFYTSSMSSYVLKYIEGLSSESKTVEFKAIICQPFALHMDYLSVVSFKLQCGYTLYFAVTSLL